MIEGPYRSTKGEERKSQVEGIFLLLQFVAVLAGAAFVGYDWLSTGQYLKFGAVFGCGAAAVLLFWHTKALIFLLALGAVALAGAWWY